MVQCMAMPESCTSINLAGVMPHAVASGTVMNCVQVQRVHLMQPHYA